MGREQDRTLKRLLGLLNMGRSHYLLLIIADRLEETGDDWLARPLRLVHVWGHHPKRIQHGLLGFCYWGVGKAYLPKGVFERMAKSRQYATQQGDTLLYRRRWDVYLAMAVAWEGTR